MIAMNDNETYELGTLFCYSLDNGDRYEDNMSTDLISPYQFSDEEFKEMCRAGVKKMLKEHTLSEDDVFTLETVMLEMFPDKFFKPEYKACYCPRED